ncbi:MAG: ammonia-forming cytochrome c nitrite reductase subunit c552 [Thermoplasmata archaeon]
MDEDCHHSGGGSLSISKKDLAAMILATAFLMLLLIAFSFFSSDITAGPTGTRGSGDYLGAVSCQDCHDKQYDSWVLSPHSDAWNTLNNSSEHQDWCEACHTTGAGDEKHNGFNATMDQPDYLKNVQCESCHGPDPMTDPLRSSTRKNFSAEVCATCHREAVFDNQSRTYHPYYDEWQNSNHSLSLTAAGGAVATDPTCQGCHVAQVAVVETIEGGTVDRPISNPQPIGCAVCHDPHGSLYQSQLRMDPADLCATCHNPGDTIPGEEIRHPQSYMRSGISGIDSSLVPKKDFMKDVLCSDCHLYSTGPPENITGHSFRPKVEACVSCHEVDPRTFSITADQASSAVSAWQASTSDSLLAVLPNLTVAQTMIENATRFGFDLSTIEVARGLYEEANYSVSFVIADKSFGAHNPQYALSLIDFAAERANTVIEMLKPGHVVGRAIDSEGNPVAGIIIRRGGLDLAVSGLDGRFLFDYASGTYDFDLVKDGNRVGRIENAVIDGGETMDVGDIRVTAPSELDLTWLLILIIVILLTVLVLLAVRDSKRKEGETEGSEKSETEESESLGQ